MPQYKGTVDRVRWSSDTWAILVMGDGTVLVGPMTGIHEADEIEAEGEWVDDQRYGVQFKVASYKVEIPQSAEALRRFLASGVVPLIGPKTADRLFLKFKDNLRLALNDASILQKCDGIGPKKAAQIVESWAEKVEHRDMMIRLTKMDLSLNYAIKLVKRYGSQALTVLLDNPYTLIRDIRGIGFKRADEIARKIGYNLTSSNRIFAGIWFTLHEAMKKGHCFVPRTELLLDAKTLLDVDATLIAAILDSSEGKLVLDAEGHVALEFLHRAELSVARKVADLHQRGPDPLEKKEIAAFLGTSQMPLSDSQKKALEMVWTHPVSVISGAAGTGKSTVIAEIVRMADVKRLETDLCAPTGRAARRMKDIIGKEASTIHRLLEYDPATKDPDEPRFKRNASNPLECDVLILDETSMVDISLMNALLEAIPLGCRVVLVGDPNQLPSVGAGNVLKDMLTSGLPVTMLMTIFRQEEGSEIISAAQSVNNGQLPKDGKRDFSWVRLQDEDEILRWVLQNATEDVQVMSPWRRGTVGITNLNRVLQKKFRDADARKIFLGDEQYACVGDRIIQTVNNYDKNIFNGNIGRVTDIAGDILTADFDGQEVFYTKSEAKELDLAYCISVHKMQGSEADKVIFVMHSSQYIMLFRQLLYTALTRSRKHVTLVAESKVVNISVRTNRVFERNTKLSGLISKLLEDTDDWF